VELAEKYGGDAVRYFVLREIPFGYDGDFSLTKFKERYDADLANALGNLISRVTNLIEKNCEGQVPKQVESPKRAENLQKLIEEFRLHDALENIWENIRWANQFIDQAKLWELPKKNPELFFEAISSLAALIKQISLELAPFLPETATKIDKILNSDSIVKSPPLFPRIE
jgi:methionyl-tRNA synthetase